MTSQPHFARTVEDLDSLLVRKKDGGLDGIVAGFGTGFQPLSSVSELVRLIDFADSLFRILVPGEHGFVMAVLSARDVEGKGAAVFECDFQYLVDPVRIVSLLAGVAEFDFAFAAFGKERDFFDVEANSWRNC